MIAALGFRLPDDESGFGIRICLNCGLGFTKTFHDFDICVRGLVLIRRTQAGRKTFMSGDVLRLYRATDTEKVWPQLSGIHAGWGCRHRTLRQASYLET